MDTEFTSVTTVGVLIIVKLNVCKCIGMNMHYRNCANTLLKSNKLHIYIKVTQKPICIN